MWSVSYVTCIDLIAQVSLTWWSVFSLLDVLTLKLRIIILLADRPADQPTSQPTERLTDRTTNRRTDGPTDWPTNQLTQNNFPGWPYHKKLSCLLLIPSSTVLLQNRTLELVLFEVYKCSRRSHSSANI